ncbi:unnamed protein product, partial [Trichogramma brassicae]
MPASTSRRADTTQDKTGYDENESTKKASGTFLGGIVNQIGNKLRGSSRDQASTDGNISNDSSKDNQQNPGNDDSSSSHLKPDLEADLTLSRPIGNVNGNNRNSDTRQNLNFPDITDLSSPRMPASTSRRADTTQDKTGYDENESTNKASGTFLGGIVNRIGNKFRGSSGDQASTDGSHARARASLSKKTRWRRDTFALRSSLGALYVYRVRGQKETHTDPSDDEPSKKIRLIRREVGIERIQCAAAVSNAETEKLQSVAAHSRDTSGSEPRKRERRGAGYYILLIRNELGMYRPIYNGWRWLRRGCVLRGRIRHIICTPRPPSTRQSHTRRIRIQSRVVIHIMSNKRPTTSYEPRRRENEVKLSLHLARFFSPEKLSELTGALVLLLLLLLAVALPTS